MALASWTKAQVIAQLDSGFKWSGATVTYAFPAISLGLYGGSERTGFVALNAGQQDAATLALSLWDDLIAPSFVNVAPGSTWTTSNIEIGASTTGVSYAHAYQPSLGSVWLNASFNSTTGTNDLVTPQVGQHGFLTYMHELGHALGLDHMGNYNGTATSPSNYQDSTVYSIMSYFGPSWGSGTSSGLGLVAWADWIGADGRRYSPQTPMVNDIMAIQTMYGAETTTRTGDTIYGFNGTVTGPQQAIFDFSVNDHPILTIFDSAGNDTLDLSGYDTQSVIDLAPGAYSSCNSMTSNIGIAYSSDIENATGGGGNDVISGNTLANILSGGLGADVLNGLGGNDTLDGGAGADAMTGGAGDDIYFVDSATDRAIEVAGAGNDTIKTALATYILGLNVEALDYIGNDPAGFRGTGNTLANTITGGAANDTLFGLTGNDVLNGLDGNDTLDGGAGADIMSGGAGDDVYFVDSATDSVIEVTGAGYDTVKTTLVTCILGDNIEALKYTGSIAFTGTGNALDNDVSGGASNDFIYGAAGNDVLNGLGGNDTLDGGAGADAMIGGTGNDTYFVDSEADAVVENAAAGNDTVKVALASYVLAGNVEALTYTGNDPAGFSGTGNALANTITGGAGNDTLNGGLGADVLNGLGGNDTLDGGAGADAMNGGAGNDIYFVDSATDRAIEVAGAGNDTIKTALATYILGLNVEALDYIGNDPAGFRGTGNTLANTITGGAANDTLFGLTGNDVLNGLDGNDTLDGGAGADIMSGGAGDDVYFVDSATDSVIEVTGAGYDTVKTTLVTCILGDNIEALKYTGSIAFTGTGNALDNDVSGGASNDFIYGAAGNDVLNGLGGNDTLDGGAGADAMIGGTGNDTYFVDSEADAVVENAAAGNDTVKVALASYVLAGNVEALTYTGNDPAGFSGTGNALANTITGGAGNDTLNGGLGADGLWGKDGTDYFDMTTVLGGGNIDVLKDYNSSDDTIRLANEVFKAFGSDTGALAESAFWSGSIAHDADDRIIFNKISGALLYDSDGTGTAGAAQFATINLAGLTGTVTYADFLII